MPYLYIVMLSLVCSLFVAVMSLTIGHQRSKMWLEAAVLTLVLSMLVLTPVKIIFKVMAVHLFAYVKTKCTGKKGRAKKSKKDAAKQEQIQFIMAEAAHGLPRAQAALTSLTSAREAAERESLREKQAGAGTEDSEATAEFKPTLKKKRLSLRSLPFIRPRTPQHGRSMQQEEEDNDVHDIVPTPLPLLFDAVRRLDMQGIRATPPPHSRVNCVPEHVSAKQIS